MKKKLNYLFDIQLLIDTLSVQAPSKDENDMINFVISNLKKNKIKYTQDSLGNIYATKGNSDLYTCFVSHMDRVHERYEDFQIFQKGDTLFAFSETEQSQVGTGGDDAVGVAICLNALIELDNIKCVFFISEEIGCVGSKGADMTFFDDCNIVLQADRRGNGDFIQEAAGVELSSQEFLSDISDLLKEHQYKVTTGSVTDVMALKKNGLKVCAANMSAGYYAPHTDKEIVVISDVLDCYGLMLDILDRCNNKVYEHTYEEPIIKSKSTLDRAISDRTRQFSIDDYSPYWFDDTPVRTTRPIHHDTTPIISLDDEDMSEVEQYLEEIDIAVTDMTMVLDDWKRLRDGINAKLGKI